MLKINEGTLRSGSLVVIIACCVVLVAYKPAEENSPGRMKSAPMAQSNPESAIHYEPKSAPLPASKASQDRIGGSYERTSPGYDSNAPVLPRYKGDVEPLYNEVQRLKEQQGMTDREAVDKILRDAGEIP